MRAAGWGGVSFLAPAWLWLLLLPVLLLLLQARSGEERWTATLEVWLRLRSVLPARHVRWRMSVRMLPLPAALACVVVALAGPFWPTQAGEWRVYVDARPRMWLVEQGRTRLEHGLDSCAAWLEAQGATARWFVDGREVAQGARLDPTRVPMVRRRGASFAAPDVAGVLWVVDELPTGVVRQAGVHVAPRSAQVGPVDRTSLGEQWWSGSAVEQRPMTAAAPRVELDPQLSPPLQALVRGWAQARGLDDSPSASGELVMRVRTHAVLGQVQGTEGLVELGPVPPAAAEGGDLSVAYALRIGETLDAARLEPADCVPVSGRAGTGQAYVVEPSRLALPASRDLAPLWLVLALVLLVLALRHEL